MNREDSAPVVVHERFVLRKFEGDWTDAEIEAGLAGPPVEVIVTETGEETIVWKEGDPGEPPR